MAPSAHDPLLPPHPSIKKPSPYSKTIFLLLLSIASLISLAALFFSYKHTASTTAPTVNFSHLCSRSPDQASCNVAVSNAVAALSALSKTRPVPAQVLLTIIQQSIREIDATVSELTTIRRSANDRRLRSSLADCVHLMGLSRDRLVDSAAAVSCGAHADAQTWLSAALTNHVTCSDGLDGPLSRSVVKAYLEPLTALASASLAVITTMNPHELDKVTRLTRKIPFPEWVTARDRKLLEAASVGSGMTANVTVAADGSGDFGTVQEAVNSAPNEGKARYVIYVKAGTYKENVAVGKSKTNVMIVGDGMNSTVITGSLNVVDGSTTFNSATLAAVADGFILQDICVENTAGPEKHQAVALRVGADRSVINRCRVDGYQDTLYAHSLRQFYRDSLISGTVDFIFGNAAVVIQNCDIVARLPLSKQENTITAQGRTDPNQNTATSIQSCKVVPGADLVLAESATPTFLGRPWKQYSRTVFMQSYIDNHVDPAGWLEWDGDFALNTLYYGEYANKGPGAGTAGRVNWTGYHVITDPSVAAEFTVAQLIQGGAWLTSAGVAFTEGL
ncbi:Pectinesterase 1 [Ananas comosus]|uniref:Pectinesterase n=1 Tax=Ananas comosus TaxID=4615 RepID=A0A199VRL7_ANACO|nr:Pectinesterase 1 [Ananas comosus]